MLQPRSGHLVGVADLEAPLGLPAVGVGSGAATIVAAVVVVCRRLRRHRLAGSSRQTGGIQTHTHVDGAAGHGHAHRDVLIDSGHTGNGEGPVSVLNCGFTPVRHSRQELLALRVRRNRHGIRAVGIRDRGRSLHEVGRGGLLARGRVDKRNRQRVLLARHQLEAVSRGHGLILGRSRRGGFSVLARVERVDGLLQLLGRTGDTRLGNLVVSGSLLSGCDGLLQSLERLIGLVALLDRLRIGDLLVQQGLVNFLLILAGIGLVSARVKRFNSARDRLHACGDGCIRGIGGVDGRIRIGDCLL